jgi:RND family efflux transporter MFP subunit
MNKLFLLTSILSLTLLAVEIPIEHAKERTFGKSIELNAQIVQLSNAKQSIMSQVGGHIEKYYVKIGQSVKDGQKIVLIESIRLSKMTADYISLKKQLNAQEKNYNATNELYKKGMTSMQELNEQSIKKDELLAKLTALESQLNTLGVNAKALKQATPNFILYAHSDGVVSAILQPLHSSIKDDTPIISVVQKQAFYLKSFLPLEYASKVKVGQKVVIDSDGKNITSHVTQILPKVDEKTQRIVLLSSIDEETNNLYINTYTAATLYFNSNKKYVAIKKSALSFFKNEWVVFMPKEEEGHDEHQGEFGEEEDHDEHNDEHDHDDHDEHENEGHNELEHEGINEHNEENAHDEHEDEEAMYEIRVVKIITQDENYVAVEGLRVDEEYVSDKSYYVKSMLLKSSLGGHGH